MIPGVAGIVGIGKTPAPIDATEIAAIKATIKSGLACQPWSFLKVGQRVRIEHGPLFGLDGILLKVKGNHRLLLSVTLLQRSIAVDLDDAWVKPVKEQSQACIQSVMASPNRETRPLMTR